LHVLLHAASTFKRGMKVEGDYLGRGRGLAGGEKGNKRGNKGWKNIKISYALCESVKIHYFVQLVCSNKK
jgi:hypothetical protein